MIIGTAGHIDHGKSRLLAALTGQRFDRLREEQTRGITIDLNFAHLDVPGGRRLGVVDVPGHEDFVRTMVAGAAGLDAVLLVIAADEGIMPQTREHRAIIEQLAVPVGLPILTKCDLVDPEWLALVRQEVSDWLASSPVSFREPIAVSAATGEGIEEVRRSLIDLADAAVRRAADHDLFRLPVDRVFSLAGAGTVVTGTTLTGTVAVGDGVVALPSGAAGRVRSIEVHGEAQPRVGPRVRAALSLAGVARDALARGATIVHQGVGWAPTRVLDAMVQLLPDAPRPLLGRTRVRLHLGTAEVMARAYPRGSGGLGAGQESLVRLVCEAPLAARGGDRLVIRSFSPVTTIGGGWVVDPAPPARRAPWPEGLAAVDPSERLAALVSRRALAGLPIEEVPQILGLPGGEVSALVAAAAPCRALGGRLYPTARLQAASERALEAMREYHRRHPAQAGLPLETLRQSIGLPAAAADALLADQVAAGRLTVEQGTASLPGFAPRVPGGGPAVAAVVEAVTAGGLSPPDVDQLGQELGRRDVRDVLRLAETDGRVVSVTRDRYYSPEALARFSEVVRAVGRQGEISVAALRDRLGLSRKFLIPLLEWSDRAGLTRRQGDTRHLT